MKGYPELLRALGTWEPRIHVFGGIAEDALLHGRLTRAHSDIDVVVYRDELQDRIEQARALGFSEFVLRMETPAGEPLVVGALQDDLNLEFVVFDRAPDGASYFDVPTPTGWKRVWMPAGAFAFAPVSLEGAPVPTVSPLALYQIREAVAETFGGYRPKDHVSQAALRKKFFAEVDEASLAPRVQRWEAAEAQ